LPRTSGSARPPGRNDPGSLSTLARQTSLGGFEKEEELRVALRQIRGALDIYRQAFDEGRIKREAGDSGYPKSLRVLVDGIEDAQSAAGGRLYFLRRLVRDPFFPDPTVPPEQTWGKRSYSSPPNAPREGKDVYDVYSLANGKGLNGVAYREW